MSILYAHSSDKDKSDWHTLEEHLGEVAAMSARFAAAFQAEDWARAIGFLHDLGKASESFQKRLEGSRQRVYHACVGAQWALSHMQGLPPVAPYLLAYPVAGHHSWLAGDNSSGLAEQMDKEVGDYSRGLPLLPPDLLPGSLPWQISKTEDHQTGFATAMMIRMLFSCLIDADRLDTERACSPEVYACRPRPSDLSRLKDSFDQYMEALSAKADGNSRIQARRQEILMACRAAAQREPGAFSLTVPTGGGKTLSSLAFALEHALRFNKKRIIYVIPYTSIIEQTAAVFAKVFGALSLDALLEHHSAFTPPELDDEVPEEERTDQNKTDMRLAEQNWDVPVVVTTAVQFFQSLFAASPSSCRKLHNIADSVVILDEAQMLPLHLLNPCVMALRELIRGYGTSVVMCTATQPALCFTQKLDAGFDADEIREIIPAARLKPIFSAFDRVRFRHMGALADSEVANLLQENQQVLCIVNTRRRARDIYEALGQGEGNFHLSALMYPEHRRRRLDEIRERLRQGLPCRVVSTSLIEAGVDIDFPSVFREEAGLDSIAQAAGRCNREGRLGSPGIVTVFASARTVSKLPSMQRRIECTRWVMANYPDRILSPEAITAYFSRLYASESSLDKNDILGCLESLMDSRLRTRPDFPFRRIAADFVFIEDWSEPVIVEQGRALELLQQLEREKDRNAIRRILRALQSYTVQVSPKVIGSLSTRMHPRFGLRILSGGTGYSDEVGLCHDNPNFREMESNIF